MVAACSREDADAGGDESRDRTIEPRETGAVDPIELCLRKLIAQSSP